MNEISKLKNGSYSVVDIHGVSVTDHFVDCLENEIDKLVEKHVLTNDKLKHQLSDSEDKNRKFIDEVCKSNVGIIHLKNQLKQAKEQLAKKEEEVDKLKYELEWAKQDLNECVVGLEQKYKKDEALYTMFALDKLLWWCMIHSAEYFYDKAQTENKERCIVIHKPQKDGSPSLFDYINNQINLLKEKK